jgi:hypothetical protein
MLKHLMGCSTGPKLTALDAPSPLTTNDDRPFHGNAGQEVGGFLIASSGDATTVLGSLQCLLDDVSLLVNGGERRFLTASKQTKYAMSNIWQSVIRRRRHTRLLSRPLSLASALVARWRWVI